MSADPTSSDAPRQGERKPLIELRGVDKAFEDNVVFEGMDLEVFEGETLSIIGRSGCGKSVALKMMTAIMTQDAGSVLYEGREVSAMNANELKDLRMDVSMLFQADALFDSMTVLENVGYALVEHTKKGDEEIRARAAECLSMVGLGLDERPDILDTYPANLSGGMRKRVALARSIAMTPRVVLYDEPTMGLDPQNCDRIAFLIRDLQRELKLTSVVVTHDMDTAFFVGDRVAIVADRRFPHVAPPDEFRKIDDPEVKDFVVRKIL